MLAVTKRNSIPTREIKGSQFQNVVLRPFDPNGVSAASIRSYAEQMKAVIDAGRHHPHYGRFVAEQSIAELVWVLLNGWALIEHDDTGVIVGCAYFKLLGWTSDGLGCRYPVFKFGGAVMRDQAMYRRYMDAALTPQFQQAVIIARTHRGFGRLLERMGFVRYYCRELKRKNRFLYRLYFGSRRPNDERDFFLRFPEDYVHQRPWQRPDRPLIYNQWQYREDTATGSGGVP